MEQDSNLVHHYTTLGALPGILQKDHVVLWATRYNYLNDPLEYSMAKKMIPFIKNVCEECKVPYDKDFKVHPYVISMCKYQDDLNMWRLYANEGNGVVLSFNKDFLMQTSHETREIDGEIYRKHIDFFQEVSYYEESNKAKEFNDCLNTFRKDYGSDNLQDDIMFSCCFMKTADYHIENEIRYARLNFNGLVAKDENSIFDCDEMMRNVKFRTRNNQLIPYIDVEFAKEAISEIVLGYQVNTEMGNLLESYLRSCGYHNVTIRISKHSMLKVKPIYLIQ